MRPLRTILRESFIHLTFVAVALRDPPFSLIFFTHFADALAQYPHSARSTRSIRTTPDLSGLNSHAQRSPTRQMRSAIPPVGLPTPDRGYPPTKQAGERATKLRQITTVMT